MSGVLEEEAEMSLRELQARVDGWISQYEEGYFPPLASLARLVEEVGELSRALSHHDGFKAPKPGEALGEIGEELGDIVFVVVCLANQFGLDLQSVMQGVLKKIVERDSERWTKKEVLEGPV